MRLSAIQNDVLFVLISLEAKGHVEPVPATRLLGMLNAVRSIPLYPNNFRTSCHLMVRNGLLNKYRNSSLQLAFALSPTGREIGKAIREKREG
ncbi:chromosome segregation protein ParM [Serratia fonticola]|uniref:chromosome segregation protein ParM n=1 Tax=Serratia fonticola TaxID=47917 RepID=UPI00301E00D5